MNTETDVLIIGAGPAGSVGASLLRKQGFKVMVVEKQIFPRFVIGESLLPYSMELLKEADLLEAVESRGFIHKAGAVFWRGQETCNFDFSTQHTLGWKYTFQVPRDEFDKTLADAVAGRGVEFLFGHGVTAIAFDDYGARVTVESADKKTRQISARFVLDCSGYGRVLPRLLDLEKPANFPNRESLFAHVTGDRRPAGNEEGKVWICIHPDGAWIWIIPFSNGRTSVGVVATPEFFASQPGEPGEQLRRILMSEPNAAARLDQMEFAMPAQRIGGYSCAVKRIYGPHYALAGNATEFLDPVFSSGVTLAMASAIRAAKCIVRQLQGEDVNWQADYADHVMQGIHTFRDYIAAWYDGTLPDVFFSARPNPDIMKQICSVLAGYVWDPSNPYAVQSSRALPLLSKVVLAMSKAGKQLAGV